MAYTAKHRFVRIGARKVRPIADMIRGKHADEALEILKYQPQRGARLIEKVLKSALGNAEDRRAQDLQDLVVVDCRAAPDLLEGDWLDVPYSLPEASAGVGLSQYELLTLLGRRFERANL